MADDQTKPQPAQPTPDADKTRPGGYYIVDGVAVDAEGTPIDEDTGKGKKS